ncbi:MAG: hypothetical protein V2J89_09230 [Halieaceae bacterium]|jgi:hypothetical protein|nr:hypothetical protein [Halieaceae bacterium]
MKTLLSVTALAAALVFSASASAKEHIEEVWECTLVEGKTVDQANSVNATWLKYVNDNVKGGNINSRAVVPLVGDMGSFLFVDSFPSLVSWAETKEVMRSGEGQKIEAALEEVAECTSNRLYASMQ